jgi:choline-glycine betaine transporter
MGQYTLSSVILIYLFGIRKNKKKKKKSVIVPLYEKGNKIICNNCRGLKVFEERMLRKIF